MVRILSQTATQAKKTHFGWHPRVQHNVFWKWIISSWHQNGMQGFDWKHAILQSSPYHPILIIQYFMLNFHQKLKSIYSFDTKMKLGRRGFIVKWLLIQQKNRNIGKTWITYQKWWQSTHSKKNRVHCRCILLLC